MVGGGGLEAQSSSALQPEQEHWEHLGLAAGIYISDVI